MRLDAKAGAYHTQKQRSREHVVCRRWVNCYCVTDLVGPLLVPRNTMRKSPDSVVTPHQEAPPGREPRCTYAPHRDMPSRANAGDFRTRNSDRGRYVQIWRWLDRCDLPMRADFRSALEICAPVHVDTPHQEAPPGASRSARMPRTKICRQAQARVISAQETATAGDTCRSCDGRFL